MNLNADHLKPLSPGLVERLAKLLREFDAGWTEQSMAATLPQLRADHALRFPTVVELTKRDLAHRWTRGAGPTLEHYLREYPELGSQHTVPVYLIRAEYDIRMATKDSVTVGEYSRRFPTQFEAFFAAVQKAKEAKEAKAKAAEEPEAAPGPAAKKSAAHPQVKPAATKPTPKPAKVQPPEPAPDESDETGPRSRAGLVVGLLLVLLIVAGGGLWAAGVFNRAKPDAGPAVASNATTNSTEPKSNPAAPAGTAGSTDPVESIIVKVDVGPGAATAEPIYLDLGLGFPLWLSPGSAAPAAVPFGAVPQQSDAGKALEPNTTATFTFLAKGDPGRDVLRTTPALLAGVRVGDIRRVGFASLAEQDWTLAGFELIVNGKPLHAAKGLAVKPKQVLRDAQTKLGELTRTAGPAARELAGLRELAQTGLATDAEKARLAELDRKPPAADDRATLERQLRGQSPWYVAAIRPVVVASRPKSLLDLFESRAVAQEPAPPAPKVVRVSIVTDASHDRADTKNYVYFRAGGRKFLIGGPDFPLTGAHGTQVVQLDLAAGPLTAADLTGWGVGVLSPAAAQGKGPDRWHARRIQVDVDGKTVFDSEQQDADRQTLAAVRLVPPAQLDFDGTAVLNPAGSRELHFWAAGHVTGFDAATGVVDPLPATTVTEGGVVPPPPETVDPVTPVIGVIPPAPPVDPAPPANPDPVFPDERPVVEAIPDAGEPPPVIIIIVGPSPEPVPAGPDPEPPPPLVPVGTPPQVAAVRFAQLTRTGTSSTVTVTWRVTGDEATLDAYEITLLGLEDDVSSVGLAPRAGALTFPLGTVPRGVFSVTATVPDSFLLAWKFVLPRVEAKPTDPAANANSRFGPARSTATHQANFLKGTFRQAGQVQGPAVAVRARARVATHTAFDLFLPENNALVVPMDTQSPETTLALRADDLTAGAAAKSVRFLAGFSGGAAPDSTVQYRVEAFATEVTTKPGGVTTTVPIDVPTDVTVAGETADADGFFTLKGSDMKLHQVAVKLPAAVSAATAPAKRWTVELTVTLKNFAGDPARPPVILTTAVTSD